MYSPPSPCLWIQSALSAEAATRIEACARSRIRRLDRSRLPGEILVWHDYGLITRSAIRFPRIGSKYWGRVVFYACM